MREQHGFVKIGSPTWNRIWANIFMVYGDQACECPETGEVWQYMGTVATYEPEKDKLEHEFRHRSFHGKRTYYVVQGRESDWKDITFSNQS